MACNCEGNTYHIGMGCCQPVVANPNSYYTKSEIDEKLSGITTDGISEDEASELIDEALLDYYTKDEIDAGFNTINLELDNKLDASAYTPTDLSGYYTKTETDNLLDKKLDKNSINGVGNIKVESGGGLNGVYIYDRAPIRGVYTNFSWESGYVNGLEIPFNNNGIAIGKFNDTNDSYISGDRVLGESYFQIGDGENLENRHNLFTIYDNGYIKTTGTDGNDVVLQDWMKESETKLSQAKSFIDEMNALALYNNRYDGIQIPFTLYHQFLPARPTYLKVTGTFDESVTSGYSITSLTLTPQAHNGTATEEMFGLSYPYTGTSNVILSGFTVDGYIPTGGLKTINGQTLEGSGDIQIGTGGTIDLSNYYTRAEVDDKLDLKANASDLSALNADVEGLSISLENKADKSDIPSLDNYYSKSQVDALIATLQSQIDALEAQLEECCSGGGGGEDMEGKKYLLHLTDETEHSMECNSSSTLSREDILFASGETLKASAITDVTIGDCVTEIAPMAMQFFSAMTSVNIPSSVTTIGYDAFDACSTLTSLAIPTGVTTIPSYLCSNDYNLATTNIPDGVTSIGINAYYDCLSLLDITIPSSVTTIGQAAFRVNNWTTSDPEKYAKMQNLLANRVVRCLATTPPSVDSITFDVDSAGVSVTYPIYVPAESVEAYKAASGWSTYADRIQAIN